MVREILQALGQLFTWLVTVAPWEQAVRVRFGKRVKLLSAGLYVRIPFFDRVYRQSIRRRLVLMPSQCVTSRDGKAITVSASLGFVVKDVLKLYNTLHDATDTLESMVAAMLARYIATHDFANCTPKLIEDDVRGQLNFERYGIVEPEFYVLNFVAVKTIRIVTGDIRTYRGGGDLNTTASDSATGRPS